MSRRRKQPLPLGQVAVTRRAVEILSRFEIMVALARHVQRDWGEVDPEDRAENDLSADCGNRVLSEYSTTKGTKFWVITEADRSTTTVLLPEEY